MVKKIILFRKDSYIRCWICESDGQKYPWITGMPYGHVHRACNFDAREVVRHLCDNSMCINPLHMRSGSLSENSQDKGRKMIFINDLIPYLKSEGFDNLNAYYAAGDVWSDMIAYELREERRELSKYGYKAMKYRKMAKYVWQNIVMRRKLVFINDVSELERITL